MKERNFGYHIMIVQILKKGYNILSSSDDLYVHNLKLTEDDIESIFNLLLNTDISQEEIAKRFNINQSVISRINTGESYVKQNISYPIRKKKKNIYYCLSCGKEISKGASHCLKCLAKMKQKKERPLRDELKKLIRNKSFVEIGRIFEVSDNTIRKWCVSENLPAKKSDIKKYTDEEWLNI